MKNLGTNGSKHYLMTENNLRRKNNSGFAANILIVISLNLKVGRDQLVHRQFLRESPCLKQVTTKQRQTTCTSAEKRNKLDDDKKKREDKILSFEAFRKELPKKVDNEFVFKISNESEITIYKTDDLGKTVMFFFHFKKVDSPIGFLKVVSVEKEGIEIQKKILGIPKNSLIHRWSQLTDIVNKTFTFEASNDKV